jgi:hypothetical protein
MLDKRKAGKSMNATLLTGVRKARKEHNCSYCNGKIQIGETYDFSKNISDGELYEWKSHKQCTAIAIEFWEWIDPDDGMSSDDFSEGCRDFCSTFICPKCQNSEEDGECKINEYFCVDKIFEILKTHDFVHIKKENGYTRTWELVEKTAVTI